ncbi:MAG TPA: uroporphyrinogen-III synthase, partial [Acidobacteriota bacterium]|nr:uroporphyrinogen-III synthase [Acidobacteriota bacterium]
MTELDRLDHWLSLLRKHYPSGFVFKDLTIATPDWSFLAGTPEPLLLLLDAAEISRAVEQLVAAGFSPATPCALLREPLITANTGTIALKSRGVSDSVHLVLFAEDITPLQRLRLEGKNVLITRAQKQAGRLRELLELEGARVLEAPAIEIVEKAEQIEELKEALLHLDSYSWLVLTSANTVSILDAVLKSISADWKLLEPLQTACIGTATANRVRESGGKVDLVPPKFQAESLAEELLKRQISGKQILLPRAEGSRRILVEELQGNNVTVHEITVYRAEIPAGGHEELRRLMQNERIDFITFTSSSTVHHFV